MCTQRTNRASVSEGASLPAIPGSLPASAEVENGPGPDTTPTFVSRVPCQLPLRLVPHFSSEDGIMWHDYLSARMTCRPLVWRILFLWGLLTLATGPPPCAARGLQDANLISKVVYSLVSECDTGSASADRPPASACQTKGVAASPRTQPPPPPLKAVDRPSPNAPRQPSELASFKGISPPRPINGFIVAAARDGTTGCFVKIGAQHDTTVYLHVNASTGERAVEVLQTRSDGDINGAYYPLINDSIVVDLKCAATAEYSGRPFIKYTLRQWSGDESLERMYYSRAPRFREPLIHYRVTVPMGPGQDSQVFDRWVTNNEGFWARMYNYFARLKSGPLTR